MQYLVRRLACTVATAQPHFFKLQDNLISVSVSAAKTARERLLWCYAETAKRGREYIQERGERADSAEAELDLKGPVRLGFALSLFGLGSFGAWAAFAPLHSAVVASGVVIVETKRKAVQHLEGGIVTEILVREGQEVRAGEPLLRLDGTQGAANRSRMEAQLISSGTEMARLEAELVNGAELLLNEAIAERADEPSAARAIALQRTLLSSRQHEWGKSQAILERRIRQIHEEIEGLTAQMSARTRQRQLIEERLVLLRELAAKGHASRAQLFELESETAAAEGDIGDMKARIAAAKQKIEETQEQISATSSSRKVQTADRLQSVRRIFAETQENLSTAEDIVRRVEVKAPTSGTIVGMNVHTIGAVVGPAQKLMEIVPAKDTLIVEGSVRPQDINAVHPGLPVQVRLSAYSFRSTSPVRGVLSHVSADHIVDPRSGIASYLVQAKLDEKQLENQQQIQLYPGMPAEIVVVKEARTFFDYLLDPIIGITERAFLED